MRPARVRFRFWYVCCFYLTLLCNVLFTDCLLLTGILGGFLVILRGEFFVVGLRMLLHLVL